MKSERNPIVLKRIILGFLTTFVMMMCPQGNTALAQDSTSDLMELSLEELMNISVTSVSKKEQILFEAAAAIYAITQDDIRRSGVTSIPEALRMVPGMQVAQIDANKWAISARGFNFRFATKLLVLIDGRSVYTPLFSGVFWDVQDLMLEDIDRIEVIRGPGATLWGANAVNGIINIITKSANETQGVLFSTGGGNEERGFGAIRYGGRLGENAYYRVYAKYFNRDNFVASPGVNTADDWNMMRGGFRADWNPSEKDALVLQGDIYNGDIGETSTGLVALTPPFDSTLTKKNPVSGGNILSRWSHAFSSQSDLAIQLYYDRAERNERLSYVRNTYDFDFQHRFELGKRHELIWGVGYRHITDNTEGSFNPSLNPIGRGYDLYSAFVQDEIEFAKNRLRLTLGSKFEHNSYTGLEIQPSARFLWLPSRRHTLWGAYSQAVRTPSRTERNLRFNFQAFLVGKLPILVSFFGNEDFESERLQAFELGYRVLPTDRISFDLATFYNIYDGLAAPQVSEPFSESTPEPKHLVIPIKFANNLSSEAYGFEMGVNLNLTKRWRVNTGMSWIRILTSIDSTAFEFGFESAIGEAPRYQIHLRSSLNLQDNLGLDAAIYHVDRLRIQDISSYTRLDLRLWWRPVKSLDLSIGVQNLLDRDHVEFSIDESGVQSTRVQRSMYGKLTWGVK